MARRSGKTKEQQEKYYGVSDFFAYLIDVKRNGNNTEFYKLYKEMNRENRTDFMVALYVAYSEDGISYAERVFLDLAYMNA